MAEPSIDPSPKRRLENYPPFESMDVQVLELPDNWRHARILLPLNERNRNPGGSMFGGCMASLADPIPALACYRQFPEFTVWTSELQVDFRRPGLTDLELRFELPQTVVDAIAEELRQRGRSTPCFEFGFYDQDDKLVAWVLNRVAIRPRGTEVDEVGALPHSPKRE
jgi:uncharacterized protein (TIGR00369 family)